MLKLTPEEMGEHLETFLKFDADLDRNAVATAEAEPVKAPRKARKPKGQAADPFEAAIEPMKVADPAPAREPYIGPDVLAEAEKAIEAARPRRGPAKLPRTGDDGK